jgi:hypothetical protein
MVMGFGLTLAENVCTREKRRRVSEISLRIDVAIIAHDSCHIIFLTGVVEGFIRVDGHVGCPVIVAPVHSDDYQPR